MFKVLVRSFLLIAFVSLTARAEVVHIATGEYYPWTTEKRVDGGFVNRVISAAFAATGRQVEYTFLPWFRARQDTQAGRFQASSYWFINEEYRRDFLVSDPIVEHREVFFFLKANPLAPDLRLADMAPYKLGATLGYSYTDELKQLADTGALTVEFTSSDITNFRKLIRGRIDLFPCEETVGWGIIKQEFSPEDHDKFSVLETPLRSVSGVLLFNKDLPNGEALREGFNRGLRIIRENGTYDRFYGELINSAVEY